MLLQLSKHHVKQWQLNIAGYLEAQWQLSIEVRHVVGASVSVGPEPAMPYEMEVQALSDDDSDDKPIAKKQQKDSGTPECESKEDGAEPSAAKPKMAAKKAAAKPKGKAKAKSKGKAKAKSKAKAKAKCKGKAKAKSKGKKNAKAAEQSAEAAGAAGEESAEAEAVEESAEAVTAAGGESAESEAVAVGKASQPMKRPSAAMKKPAAAGLPAFQTTAYKYKYHDKEKWGIKFRGKEFCTVQGSVKNIDFELLLSFVGFHWLGFFELGCH